MVEQQVYLPIMVRVHNTTSTYKRWTEEADVDVIEEHDVTKEQQKHVVEQEDVSQQEDEVGGL